MCSLAYIHAYACKLQTEDEKEASWRKILIRQPAPSPVVLRKATPSSSTTPGKADKVCTVCITKLGYIVKRYNAKMVLLVLPDILIPFQHQNKPNYAKRALSIMQDVAAPAVILKPAERLAQELRRTLRRATAALCALREPDAIAGLRAYCQRAFAPLQELFARRSPLYFAICSYYTGPSDTY